MFRILIQDEKDRQKWNYLKVKKEDTETKTEEIEDPDTHEIKTVTTEVGLGTYSSVIYEESDPVEYEKKCIIAKDKNKITSINLIYGGNK